jgi:restriction system protein
MTIGLPKYDELMFPTLRVIAELGGSASIEEIQDRLVEKLGFTDGQLAITYAKSGAVVLPDRMSWARSFLRLAGLLENPKKGVWVLTEEGRAAAQTSDAAVKQRVKAAYKASLKAKKAEAAAEAQAQSEADDGGEGDKTQWSDILLAKLQGMDPSAFERLSQRLLRESGFVRVEVTGKSGDGGIDGHGVLRMNLISFQVLFQCKRYKGSVAAGAVRDFRGAMQGRADKGLIITTGTFTPDARREATRDGAPAIDLIDGEALTDLLKSLKLGVRVEPVVSERVSVDEVFFDEI